MSEKLDTIEILLNAKGHLQNFDNWSHPHGLSGREWRINARKGGPTCVVGALEFASFSMGCDISWYDAREALTKALPDNTTATEPADYNDLPSTSYDDILALYDRALLAERGGVMAKYKHPVSEMLSNCLGYPRRTEDNRLNTSLSEGKIGETIRLAIKSLEADVSPSPSGCPEGEEQ